MDGIADRDGCRKIPWRLSSMQKARQRKRLKLVDKVVDTVSMALQNNGGMTAKAVDRWYQEMPREEEMLPKDKYTIFDRKEKRYRKGIHKSVSDSTHLASRSRLRRPDYIHMDGLFLPGFWILQVPLDDAEGDSQSRSGTAVAIPFSHSICTKL
ncbi:hypothetical protein H2204_009242 [Knufia peltigerae]|uniref:Uncharacterized protein n=1 Tax=Knufia peltigerae TaxID=1002370 RepID=A0AA39CV59_9EURO|nr:hypothetical protein H2204_009242 [Knufia peltigerae]